MITTIHGSVSGRRALTPISLSPALWLPSETVSLADDEPVTIWADQSGNGRDAALDPGDAVRPLYKVSDGPNGQPCVRFDGINDFFAVAVTTSATRTLSMVLRKRTAPSDETAGAFSFADDPNNSFCYLRADSAISATNWVWCNGSSSLPVDTGIPATEWAVVTLVFTSVSGLEVYMNGVRVMTTDPANNYTSSSTFRIGARGSSSEYCDVDFAEIVYFDSSLSNANRNKIERYLGQKYGIAVASPKLFALDASNSAINESVTTLGGNYAYPSGTNISFRVYGKRVRLVGVRNQNSPPDINEDNTVYSGVYVNGNFLQLFPGVFSQITLADNPSDQWVEVEIRALGSWMVIEAMELLEVTGSSPRVEYIPALGKLISISDFRATKSQGSGNLTNRGTIYSTEMDGDGLGILFGGTVPDMATVSGWVDGSGGVAAEGYNSNVWGQVYELTSGAAGAVREHLWRVPGAPTIAYVFARQVSAQPAPSVNSGKVVVVTGTSITVTPSAATYDSYPDRIMALVDGRLKVVNLGVGSSSLFATEGQGAPLFDTEANKTQIVSTLQQASTPILYISHIGNDMYVNNTDGSPRTPTDVKNKLVELVTYFKTQVPTLSKVLLSEIETAYRESDRATWLPALSDAATIINATYANLVQVIDTDDLYASISTVDGVHPDSAGAAAIATHHLPYFEALI